MLNVATRVIPAVGIAEPVRIVTLRTFYFKVDVELSMPSYFITEALLVESGLPTLKLYVLKPRLLV